MNTIHWQITIAAFFTLLLLISLRKRRRHPMRTGDLVLYVHPNPEPGMIMNNVITRVLDGNLSTEVCILRWQHTTVTVLKKHCTILPVDLRSHVFVPKKPCARTYNIDSLDTFVELGSEVSPESTQRLFPYNYADFGAIPLNHFGYTLGIRNGVLAIID